MIRNHLRHAKNLLVHKHYVLLAGWHLTRLFQGRLTDWYVLYRCLIHDWTKFLPSEWFPYVSFYYGQPTGNREVDARWCAAYDRAERLHYARNPHHPEYHQAAPIRNCALVPMSVADTAEMVCDWVGANRARGGLGLREWYTVFGTKKAMHPDTRRLAVAYLDVLCYRMGLK